MKTLQVTGNSAYGGAGYLLKLWCEYLLARNCQVDVLATDPLWVSILQEIPRLRVIQGIYIPRNIAPLTDLRALNQLLLLLQQERYEVVHTYTATPGFLGRLAARLMNVPVILHHQAGWTVTEFSPLPQRIIYTPLEFAATMVSTKSICVSHAVAQQARALHIAPQKKLATICNGIDPQPFMAAAQHSTGAALRQELGIPLHHLLLGNTGRLSAQKDNGSLIQAMVPLKSLLADTPFTLLLAGDGPQQQSLQELAQSLGVGHLVRFLGFRADIPAFLNSLDIFISPSLWEGLSISLLEAMAAGKPIVTTTIAPNAELITHEVSGLLVPPRNPYEIAQAITRFAQEPPLAQSCALAARQKVLQSYSIDRMFQETWKLYRDLLLVRQPKRVAVSMAGKH